MKKVKKPCAVTHISGSEVEQSAELTRQIEVATPPTLTSTKSKWVSKKKCYEAVNYSLKSIFSML